MRYLAAGAVPGLRRRGFDVVLGTVERSSETEETLAAVAEGNRALAAHVASAVAAGDFPLVLSGGCSACVGVLCRFLYESACLKCAEDAQ